MSGSTRDSLRIYMDHAATTPVRPEVKAAMEPYLTERFGNPSSLYREGREARAALERAREGILSALRGENFRLAFTGGGTEADNAVILGVLLAQSARGLALEQLHVVASAVEHPAILEALEGVSPWGVQHTRVPVNRDGRVDPADVLAALRPETVLVSVMAANNEVGTLQPIREIGTLLRDRGVAFHTDAIQLLGKAPLELDGLSVDLVTLSAHKVYGPKGVGVILVREGLPFLGSLRGGSQEGGLRGGTEGVAGAIGFARAVELAVEELPGESHRLSLLQDQLRGEMRRTITGVCFNSPDRGAAPHILNASFEGVEGESLLLFLDHLGVAVSTGSACNVGRNRPSHVLEAMGRTPPEVRGSLRFSVGRLTGEREVEDALGRVTEALKHLRSIAPSRTGPS